LPRKPLATSTQGVKSGLRVGGVKGFPTGYVRLPENELIT